MPGEPELGAVFADATFECLRQRSQLIVEFTHPLLLFRRQCHAGVFEVVEGVAPKAAIDLISRLHLPEALIQRGVLPETGRISLVVAVTSVHRVADGFARAHRHQQPQWAQRVLGAARHRIETCQQRRPREFAALRQLRLGPTEIRQQRLALRGDGGRAAREWKNVGQAARDGGGRGQGLRGERASRRKHCPPDNAHRSARPPNAQAAAFPGSKV